MVLKLILLVFTLYQLLLFKYQLLSNALTGEFHRQTIFHQNLEKLKGGETSNLKKFLNEVLCGGLDNAALTSCQNIETYEASPIKIYKGQSIDIYKDPSHFAPLSSYLDSYVTHLLKLHKDYFLKDADFLQLFDEIDARLWTLDLGQPDANDHPIVKIARFFKINNQENLGYLYLNYYRIHLISYQKIISLFRFYLGYDQENYNGICFLLSTF